MFKIKIKKAKIKTKKYCPIPALHRQTKKKSVKPKKKNKQKN